MVTAGGRLKSASLSVQKQSIESTDDGNLHGKCKVDLNRMHDGALSSSRFLAAVAGANA